jgi:hypothetical protein
MKDTLKKNTLVFLIFFAFLLIYISPLILQLYQIKSNDGILTLFNGTNFNGGTRTVQYLPILKEIVSENNLFQNSVNQYLPAINFENIRIIPFLIAALPSLISDNMSVIIALNYLIGYFLNVLIIYLIFNKFINNKILSIYLSATCFLASGIIKFQVLATFMNYFMIQTRIYMDYSHISANIDLIFQALSNFILLLFFYLFINFREFQSTKKIILLITVFIFLGFSYQVHLIIGYAIIFISYIFDHFTKRYKSNLLLFLSTFIFIIVSILQVVLIKEGSWSSADYTELNSLESFFYEILNIFEKLSIVNIFNFLANSYLLIPILLFYIFKNEYKIQQIFIPIFIISIIFSFLFFNFNFLNLVSTRVLVRGSDVLIGLGIFLALGLFITKTKTKVIKTFFIILLFYISMVPSIKIINMAKYNFESKRFYTDSSLMNIYNYLNNNVRNNSLVVSDDPYDWELMPIYTNMDMYYSNIFNSYRDPKVELLKYFDFLNFMGISYSEFMTDFSNIIEIRKNYKINANNIRNRLTTNYKILNNENDYKMFLISRNMLGFSMTHGLIFNKFNEKDIKYSIKSFEKILFPELKKIYDSSNPRNILGVDYLVLKKSTILKKEYEHYFKEVFRNSKKIIYKKK